MIFALFTGIIFVAELIIAFTLVIALIKLDLKLINLNNFMQEIKPKIAEIVKLMTGISEQIVQLSPEFAKKLEGLRNQIILWEFKSIGFSILILFLNVKILKKLKYKKFLKVALKGLSLMQNMV